MPPAAPVITTVAPEKSRSLPLLLTRPPPARAPRPRADRAARAASSRSSEAPERRAPGALRVRGASGSPGSVTCAPAASARARTSTHQLSTASRKPCGGAEGGGIECEHEHAVGRVAAVAGRARRQAAAHELGHHAERIALVRPERHERAARVEVGRVERGPAVRVDHRGHVQLLAPRDGDLQLALGELGGGEVDEYRLAAGARYGPGHRVGAQGAYRGAGGSDCGLGVAERVADETRGSQGLDVLAEPADVAAAVDCHDADAVGAGQANDGRGGELTRELAPAAPPVDARHRPALEDQRGLGAGVDRRPARRTRRRPEGAGRRASRDPRRWPPRAIELPHRLARAACRWP